MGLELITGPANAEKAGAVLARVREFADAQAEPLLVVPTQPDALAYRRELARAGYVFGVSVLTFRELRRELARRAGVDGSGASAVVRLRVAQAATAATQLDELAASAAAPGFAAALAALCGELAERRIGAGLWITAMREWGRAEPGRAAYAGELAALYGAYRDRIAEVGGEPAARVYAVHDELRNRPEAWGGTPVLLYGFDDFTPTELDAVTTLAGIGAPVVVSLPFEEGREDIYRARSRTLGALLELAGDGHRRLGPGPEPVAALAHLERSLLVPDAQRADPGDALTLLVGGGELAELELMAETVRCAIADDGLAPHEIAVALRDADAVAPQVERAFAQAGVPVAVERRVTVGHTSLGRALLSLLAAALPGGTATDLIAWLRAPGTLDRPELADTLERAVRRRRLTSAADAHELWHEIAGFRFAEIAELAAAAGDRDPGLLCERLVKRAEALLERPWRASGVELPAGARDDARVLAVLRRALDRLATLAREQPSLAASPEELGALLAAERVVLGDAPGPGVVTVQDPLRLRARRMRMLVLGRLQEGIFPSTGSGDPFLGDAERLAINTAGGLRLPLREDSLDAERWLLYSAVSRPTRHLVLAWHRGDDEGEPRVRSLFADDVLAVFDERLGGSAVERRLGEVGFGPHGGSARQRRLASAAAAPAPAAAGGIGALTDPGALAVLQGRGAWGAGTLETWDKCPARWLIDWLLHPEGLDPDPAPMLRGSVYHGVLQRTFEQLGARLTPAQLPNARSIALGALREECARTSLAGRPQEHAAAARRLEADVLRYLAVAAESGTAFRPSQFELAFGLGDEDRPPVDLGDGLVLSGRIDRVDLSTDGAEAIVVDYKGSSGTRAQAKWEGEHALQVGLYALALPALLPGVRAVGALYQPIGGRDQRPRGFVEEGADPDRVDIVCNDRLDSEQAAALLERVRAAAAAAAAGIRAGAVSPNPGPCGYGDEQCAHPSICRCTP